MVREENNKNSLHALQMIISFLVLSQRELFLRVELPAWWQLAIDVQRQTGACLEGGLREK